MLLQPLLCLIRCRRKSPSYLLLQLSSQLTTPTYRSPVSNFDPWSVRFVTLARQKLRTDQAAKRNHWNARATLMVETLAPPSERPNDTCATWATFSTTVVLANASPSTVSTSRTNGEIATGFWLPESNDSRSFQSSPAEHSADTKEHCLTEWHGPYTLLTLSGSDRLRYESDESDEDCLTDWRTERARTRDNRWIALMSQASGEIDLVQIWNSSINSGEDCDQSQDKKGDNWTFDVHTLSTSWSRWWHRV